MAKNKKSKKTERAVAPLPITPTKNRGGRPTLYGHALVKEICTRLMNGELLKNICKDEHMPTTETIYSWLHDKKEFSDLYARARQVQANYWAEECIDLSDEANDGESASAQRLKVDTRKWIAAKLYPKFWGDNATGFDTTKGEGKGDVVATALGVLDRSKESKSGGGGTGGEDSGGV